MTTLQKILWLAYAAIIAGCGYVAGENANDVRLGISVAVASSIITAVLHFVVKPAACPSSSASRPSSPSTSLPSRTG